VKLPFQLDRYSLTEQVGAGAFGRVYRAEVRGDMGFVSDFAVKVLDAAVVADNPNVARQMADEARILAQLDHPNIVKVIDFKHTDHPVIGDIYFMVLEYVRGIDVADVLDRFIDEGRYIPATAALHMGLMVADALAHAHELAGRDGRPLGLVHRDLKPSNLMVNFRGQVKVLDFGIAKAKDHRLAARTQEGQTKGTVFYMSPEQLTGEELDARADLYSLGAILFEMLLGRRLLDVDVNTPADLARAMHTAFEMDVDDRLAELRAHLDAGHCGELPEEAIDGWIALLKAALQKDRRYRPDSTRMFSEQLEWLRARHPAAENRNFWASVVEGESGFHSLPPRQREPDEPEDVPAVDIAEGGQTSCFFGFGTDVSLDELPAPAAGIKPNAVPVTRAMSVVTGQVRAFGSDAIERLAPVGGLQAPHVPVVQQELRPLEESLPPQVAPARSYGQTLETAARANAAGAASSPSAPPPDPTPAEDERTEEFQPTPIPKASAAHPVRSARRAPPPARPAGPDRRVLLGVLLGLILLIGLLAVVARQRAAPEVVAEPEPTDDAAVIAPEDTPAPTPAPTPEEASSDGLADAGADDPEATDDGPMEDDGPEDVAVAPTPPEAATPPPTPTPASGRTAAATPAPRATPRPTPAPRATPAPAAAASASDTTEVGMLHLSARPRCLVTIGDKAYGTTDETRRGIPMAPGTYKVHFQCDDEAECASLKKTSGKKTLVVRAGEKTTYTADFYDLNARLQ
jgi:serine/threonine protein kinase/cytoskeletal protein RodZ